MTWDKNWRGKREEVWGDEVFSGVTLSVVEDILALKRHIRKGKVCSQFRKNWRKANPDIPPPSSPFRAYSYTTSKVCSKSDPVSQWGPNFENKIVICDEIHRMVEEVLPSQRDAIARVIHLHFVQYLHAITAVNMTSFVLQ